MRHALLIGAIVWLLAGCAGPGITPLRVGATEADVLQTWGPPTARYPLPGGARLEYATGPYGRTTWMVDLDAAGRVTARRQVLDDRHLQQVQGQLPGMTREQLLQTLGRPGEVRSGGWQGGHVWSWRYDTHLCLWFQVSIGDDGIVRDGAFGPDPACDDDVAAGPPVTLPFDVERIDHLVLRVRDPARSVTFYRELLGCEVVRRRDDLGLVHLRAGASMIDLVSVHGPLGRPGGAPAGAEGRNVDHLCLRIEPFDETAIRAHLARHGLPHDAPVQTNFGAEGEGPSIYLRDPDDNVIELKGPARAA